MGVKRWLTGGVWACSLVVAACGDPTGATIELPPTCAVDERLYATALARDGWVLDNPGAIMRSAFPDPAIDEPMHHERIVDPAGIHAANASIFTLQAGFERAYECMDIVGVTALAGDGARRPQIRVDYVYHGQQRQAYAYGEKPQACVAGPSSALVIPGSGNNQSSAIIARDPANYHAGVLDALEGVDRVYVLLKPNEDVLAWHDGNRRKLDGTLIWNWHLNREGSYSVAYLVQAVAVQKWLDDCFSRRVLAGLSQGGAAALLVGIQARPTDVVVSSGHSLLFNEAEWAGHNQLLGVPGLARLYQARPLAAALERSSSRWLFTYGRSETDIYKLEAETGLTASHIGHLPNVEVATHPGGHVFPVDAVRSFLALGASRLELSN
jgi:hypothetical protein